MPLWELLGALSCFFERGAEWLNSETLNVVFETAADASAAFMAASKPIPVAVGVPPVPQVWREAREELVKGKSDKWARKGARTRVWLRMARAEDTEEFAVSTAGAKTHGLLGESLRRKAAQEERRERLRRAAAAQREADAQARADALATMDSRASGRGAGRSEAGSKRVVVLGGGAAAPTSLRQGARGLRITSSIDKGGSSPAPAPEPVPAVGALSFRKAAAPQLVKRERDAEASDAALPVDWAAAAHHDGGAGALAADADVCEVPTDLDSKRGRPAE